MDSHVDDDYGCVLNKTAVFGNSIEPVVEIKNTSILCNDGDNFGCWKKGLSSTAGLML